MALTLSITKSPAGVTPAESQKRFSESGGSVGRGDSNDMVLDDPDRFLSTCHCKISSDAGRFFLTDMSTNGTFLNSAPEPIGKGVTVALAHSDTIEVGDYQFRVDLDESAAESSSARASNPSPFGDTTDPFGSVDDFADFAPNKADPFGTGSAGSLDGLDPAKSFSNEDPFASDPFGLSGNQPVVSDPSQENFDPLAALDQAGSGHRSASGRQDVGSNLSDLGLGGIGGAQQLPSDLDDDLLGFSGSGSSSPDPFGRPASTPPGPTHSDGAAQLNQAVSWPEPKESGVIPDDWDDLLGDSPIDDSPFDEPAPFGNSGSGQHIPAQPDFDRQDHRSLPLTDRPVHQSSAAPRAPASSTKSPDGPIDDPLEALLQARPPESAPPKPFAREATPRENPRAEAPQPQPQQPREQQPSPAPREPNAPARARPAGSGSSLLEAMDINVSTLSESEIAEIERSIGELMPVIVGGMMQVLRSRTSIKNEFRMNVTTIQPVENNPLKFSANPSDAIDNMFLRKSGAYKAPVDAFKEGFDGIGEHQVAIIAGIRAAFESMMERFNPVGLEKQFDKYNKGVTLPGMQKAKYWNSYIDHYKGLVDNMENSFQYLFGDEFVQAYEDQLRILSTDRKHKR